MGRKKRSKAREHEEAAEVNGTLDGASTTPLVFSGNDDDETNQDLSLKIVEKALRARAAKLAPNEAVLNGSDCVDSPSQQSELAVVQTDAVADLPCGIAALEVMDEEKQPKLWAEPEDQSVILLAEQEVGENIKTTENHESVYASAVQMGDNMVLRKLLRGPRYFDPPDSSWGACYNCGEEGHAAVNCTAAKRKKPCYRCGGLGHNAKQCTKAQDCFICKKGGHRSNNCPGKHMSIPKSMAVCLRCGNSGHDMFSCRNDYSADDLKEIQCYLCKTFGHFCCVNTDDVTPGGISCYKCGQLGHTGLACSRLQGETNGAGTPSSCFRCGEGGHFARECTNPTKACSRQLDETNGSATPSSCYRCGEGGHFARECTNSTKAGKKIREFSNTKSEKSYKENDHRGHRSAPRDIGKMHKMKRPLTEGDYTTPKKSKSRGGWMEHHTKERGFTKQRCGWTVEHPRAEREFQFQSPNISMSRGGWTTDQPGEFSSTMPQMSSWSSPGTPYARSTAIHSYGSGSGSQDQQFEASHSMAWNGQKYEASHFKVWNGQHFQGLNSQAPAKVFDHRYSASRFGNSSSDGHRSNWW